MSEPIQVIEDDFFISVRNVLVPKAYIQQVEESMPGCKLVPDSETDLIMVLDREYKKVRASMKEVGKIQIGNDLYFPIQIKIESPIPMFTGPTIDGHLDRPAWFRLRKQFVVK